MLIIRALLTPESAKEVKTMKRESLYGDNIEQLNDTSQNDMRDNHTYESEIYGEDSHAEQACTLIDIAKLAAGSLQLISHLRQNIIPHYLRRTKNRCRN